MLFHPSKISFFWYQNKQIIFSSAKLKLKIAATVEEKYYSHDALTLYCVQYIYTYTTYYYYYYYKPNLNRETIQAHKCKWMELSRHLLISTLNICNITNEQVKGDFCVIDREREREKKGGKKKRIQWRAMAAFINGGHQPVRCPRFRLSAKGGSIFINAWHLDSYFKYTPSEYHEFVFNKSADEWAHRFWLPPCYRNRAPVNKRFSFFLEPTPIAFSSSPLESFSSLFFLQNCDIISKTPLPRFRKTWESES